MPKFGYVYRIIDNTNGTRYYGSTTQTVAQRMGQHRSTFKNGKLGCSSVEILKNGNWRYETLEKVIFEEKFELRNRERCYIENNECLNKNIPNRTDREYRIDNVDKIKQYNIDNPDYQKQYRIANADKQRTKSTCECGGKYTHQNKSTHIKTPKHQTYLKSIEQYNK